MVGLDVDSFKNFKRYTCTHVISANLQIDHIALFNYATFPELDKDPFIDTKRPNIRLSTKYNGSILQIKVKDLYKKVHVRGYGQNDPASMKCFNNSTTIVMYIDKIIVIKVPSKGKIQATGSTTENQIYQAIHHIWKHILKIKEEHPEIARIPYSNIPRVIFLTSMNNVSMNLGFKINKRKLFNFLYKETDFIVIPHEKKYAGIAAKLPVEGIKELPFIRHRYIRGQWYQSKANWTEYLSMLSPKDRAEEERSERYHTFLIFHSGKVIQSGPHWPLMPAVFKYFIELMMENRAIFEDLTIELTSKKKAVTE